MKQRSVFPAIVRTAYLPFANESAVQEVLGDLSASSQCNYATLQRIFCTEIGPRRTSFGYSAAAADGRWLLLASTADTDEVIGYAECRALEIFGKIHGLINSIVVLPEYRRQGVAQSLISGVQAVFTAHQDPPVAGVAAIVPARRQEALDVFLLAGFDNPVKGDEYLFLLAIPAQ